MPSYASSYEFRKRLSRARSPGSSRERFACLFGDLELHGPPSLLLHDYGASGDDVAGSFLASIHQAIAAEIIS